MPLRSKALIIAAFIFQSCHSWADVKSGRSSSDPDDLPVVPGCRLLARDDPLELTAYCTSFNISEISFFLPNNTTRLQIYEVYDLDTSRPLFENLSNLRKLELPENDLLNFESRILVGLSNLRSLSLRRNRIKRLSDDTFVHNPLLEKIDLSRNWIFSVEAVVQSLSGLAHLREINLANNMAIFSLTYADFAPLQNTTLRSLLMDGCPIERIDQDAFKPLKNLSTLDLSFSLLDETAMFNSTKSLQFSSLTTIKLSNLRHLLTFPRRFFEFLNMTPVAEIDISFNRFVAFPFGGNLYPELRFLDMTACGLEDGDILPSSFCATPNLETLILRRNHVSAVGKKFAPLNKLKKLDISDPTFAVERSRFTIENFAFQNLSNLEHLSLEGQIIRHGIERHTLHGLSGLMHLILRNCGIKVMEEYAFETLQNLEILDLSYNFIGSLASDTLYGLRSVRSIDLRSNSVTSLKRSNLFQHTPALESLFLSGNKISELSPGMFDTLPKLGEITLSNNFIAPWHNRVLTVNVSILGISGNRIDYFSPEMLDDVRHLETLDFSYNPFNCSVCGMAELQLWMRNTSTNIYLLDQNESLPYVCIAPPGLANVSILDAKIPVEHCTPEELDVFLLSLITIIPFFACFVLASIVWYFLAWHIRYCCFRVKARVRVYKEAAKSDKFKYDAYVSYSPKDVLWIRDCLVPALESGDHAYRLCIPDRDFEASINVTKNVFGAVQNSRTTILVLSNAYLESEWCKFDMDMAQHKLFEDTRSLILILLEEVDSAKMTKNLKYIIKTRTFIPWTNNSVGQRLFWERLRLAVAQPNERTLSKHIT